MSVLPILPVLDHRFDAHLELIEVSDLGSFENHFDGLVTRPHVCSMTTRDF